VRPCVSSDILRPTCRRVLGLRLGLLCPQGGSIKRYRDPSVCPLRLSVPWRSCLGYRHAGCPQLSHRRPPEMCGLRTRPLTDVDPPRLLPPSNRRRQGGAYRLAAPGAIPLLWLGLGVGLRVWLLKTELVYGYDLGLG